MKKICALITSAVILVFVTIPILACVECATMGVIPQHSETMPTGFYIAGILGFIVLALILIIVTKPKKKNDKNELSWEERV